MQSFTEAVEWLEAVPRYSHKDGLCNMVRLMNRLGDVQNKLRVIHVAGTNGKGSCVAMLSRILECAGFKVGRYISPHLVSYTERISINGQDISEADFLRLSLRVREEAEAMMSSGENHPTFFELLTAVAFLYFAEQGVDYVLLEVGVGGRLDATNIVEKPVLCLIASISLDHVKVLGNTIVEIAGEKAGIIKPGCPIVCEANPKEAFDVIRAKAEELYAPFYYAGDIETTVLSCNSNGLKLNLKGKGFSYRNLTCPLVGTFQENNLCAVVLAAEILMKMGIIANRHIIRKGIRTVYWPGRMEYITYGGRRMLIDGAHNPDAAKYLTEFMATQGKSVTLVYSALAKKDVAGVIEELAKSPWIKRVIFAPLRAEDKPISFADAQEMWYSERKELLISEALSTEDALEKAVKSSDETVICAGSLYFIGEIKEVLKKA